MPSGRLGCLVAEARPVRRLTRWTQGAEQGAHLGDRLARGRLDGLQCGRGPVGVGVDEPAGPGGLHAHDRDVVGDDVVQLAGDPQPLVDDGLVAQPSRLLGNGAACWATRAWSRALFHADCPSQMAPPK